VLHINGCLDMDCARCSASLKTKLKCMYYNDIELDQDEPVIYDRILDIEYNQCPRSTIPKVVEDLYDRYNWIKEFTEPISERSTSALFWYFVKRFNYYTYVVQEYKHKDSLKKNNK
jgi:hypothetical protein